MSKMFYMKSITKLKFLFIVLSLEGIKCSIDGTITTRQKNGTKSGEDPCNPLYWYPQQIPEYCHFRKATPPTDPWAEHPIPLHMPMPIPAPLPMLADEEVPPLMMPPPPGPPGPSAPLRVPHPIMPLPIPLPFGIPLAPTNAMVPVAGIPVLPSAPGFAMPFQPQYPPPYPAPYAPPFPPPSPPPFPAPYPGQYAPAYPSPYPMPPRMGMGMVPGIPGLVSPDGGINILPFSDAYSDMLENHKQKMIMRRLRKFLNDYEKPPWKSRRNTRIGNEVAHEGKFNENEIFER